MNRISNSKIERKIKFHELHHIPYTLEIVGAGRRCTFKSSRGEYMSRETEFTSNDMNFIKAVKRHVINEKTYITIENHFKREKDRGKIRYYHYNPEFKAGKVITDCFEIDLKKAYFETAYKFGIIDKDLYDLGSDEDKINKVARLASIGTLAKKTRKLVYDGVSVEDVGTIKSTKTEFLWDTICYKVGQIMMEAAKIAGDDFIFLWVDAIFVHGASKNKIVELFKSYDYKDSHISKCEKLEFLEKKIIVTSEEKGKEKKINGKNVWVTQRMFPFGSKRRTA